MKLKTPIGIVRPTRSASGKLAGALAAFEPHELIAPLLSHVAVGAADEVLIGCVRNGIGNIARVAALQAGIAEAVPATTIDRQCASSLEALRIAAAQINAGMAQRLIVGGVESASRCPWLLEKTARPFAYGEPKPFRVRMSIDDAGDNMGETAEILADEFGITREQMDGFALASHTRAAKATQEGLFGGEILPLPPRGKQTEAFSEDETIRSDTTLPKLAKLPPAFRKDGRVTPGNSSPFTDGASACYVASLDALEKDGVKPDAVLRAITVVALEPRRMGMGPALAIPQLLEECGLKASDIDMFEINEAFAAQILAVNTELNLPADILNVNGGAIAIGHPFGATGIRLIATLTNALKQQGGKRGIASLCIGGGQGMAALIELNT